MANERFLVTALPYSVDPAARFHVSLYVTPRLDASATDRQLRQFPLFAAWTDALVHARLGLADQTGQPFQVTAVSEIKPGLWADAFPGDTQVRDRTRPPWSGRQWKSFSTRFSEQAAKALHALAVAGSPLDLPAPSQSPLV